MAPTSTSLNRLQGNRLLHSIDASLTYEEAYADEYRQERITETNPDNGQTSIRWNTIMTYKKRYQLKKLDLNAHYRLTFTDASNGQKGYVGAAYSLKSVKTTHLLPVSKQEYVASTVMAEGGVTLFKRHLLVDAQFGGHFATKAELNLADPTTDYAVNVLIPDMDILDANYWFGTLQVEYQHPISIKGVTTQWFARAHGSYIGAQHSLHRSTIGLSIGLYY